MPAGEAPAEHVVKVAVVETVKGPSHVVGIPLTITPSSAGIQPFMPASQRRVRAVISITGNGTVALSPDAAQLENGAGTMAQGFLVTAPAVFELQSTNVWYVGNVTGTASLSVITETDQDI